jgi:hypothetical protein
MPRTSASATLRSPARGRSANGAHDRIRPLPSAAAVEGRSGARDQLTGRPLMQSHLGHCDRRCHAGWVRRSGSRLRNVAQATGLQQGVGTQTDHRPRPEVKPSAATVDRTAARTWRAGDPRTTSPRNKGAMSTKREVTLEPASAQRAPLASGSVREHLFRGAVGLAAAVLAIVLVAVVGPISLLLLLLTAVAWRGCPTCWTVGLLGTLADHRARRGCSRC